MDYRKLCVELFGIDDEAALRKIATEYKKRTHAMLAGSEKHPMKTSVKCGRCVTLGHPCRNWQGNLGSPAKR